MGVATDGGFVMTRSGFGNVTRGSGFQIISNQNPVITTVSFTQLVTGLIKIFNTATTTTTVQFPTASELNGQYPAIVPGQSIEIPFWVINTGSLVINAPTDNSVVLYGGLTGFTFSGSSASNTFAGTLEFHKLSDTLWNVYRL